MHFNIINKDPYYVSGKFKWYLCDHINKYLIREQADNLPTLNNITCFIVINDDTNINDLVLLERNEIIKHYSNTLEGYDQLIAFINILKVDKHYKTHE